MMVQSVCLVCALLGLAWASPASTAATLTEQEQCAAAAKRFYDDQQPVHTFKDDPINLINRYQSHFNTRIGKCLILIEVRSVSWRGSPDEFDYHSWDIYDAIENRHYAVWTTTRSNNGDDSSGELMPEGQGTNYNVTRKQFDDFVNRYMSE